MTSKSTDSAYGSGGCAAVFPSLTDASVKKTKKDACSGRPRPRILLPEADSKQKIEEENTSLKTSIQCIKVLRKLLNDRDKSLNTLEQNLRDYKLAIEHLQSRLHKNKLASSVDLQEHEIFVPGHDKEVLKDLLNETIRLRRIIDAKYSSEEVAEAQEIIEDLREEISKLSKKLKLNEKNFADHLNDMKGSDNEKNAIISKLRCELRQYYTQRAYDDDVRLTMSAEVEQLKMKMGILVSEMGNMAKELKAYEQKEKVWEDKKKFEDYLLQNDSGLSMKDECKSLKEQAVNLKRENDDLSKQLKDVISMNTRWQKYSDQREAYVIQLTEKNQMKTSENKVLESKCQEHLHKLKELERSLKQKESKQKDDVDAAVISLEADLGRSQEQNIKLHKKISTLEKQIQGQRPSSPEQSERIMLLEHQVKSLTEDFELERKDRTNLQERHQQLQESHQQLKRRNQQLLDKNDQLSSTIVRLNEAVYQPTNQPTRLQPQQQQPRFEPFRMENTCGYDPQSKYQSYLPDQVEVDGCGQDFIDFAESENSKKSPSQMQRFGGAQPGIHGDYNADGGSLEEDEQLLHCPRCYKGFKVMEHAQLLDHVDTCNGHDNIEID